MSAAFPHDSQMLSELLKVYGERLREMNLPLRLLCEQEISRLHVWNNPLNDPKKGVDAVASTEKTVLEVSLLGLSIGSFVHRAFQTTWPAIVRTVWQFDPAIAIFLAERFPNLSVRQEVIKRVRASSVDVLDTPEAIPLLIGERLDSHSRRDLKVRPATFSCVVMHTDCSGTHSTFYFGRLSHPFLRTRSSRSGTTATRWCCSMRTGFWRSTR